MRPASRFVLPFCIVIATLAGACASQSGSDNISSPTSTPSPGSLTSSQQQALAREVARTALAVLTKIKLSSTDGRLAADSFHSDSVTCNAAGCQINIPTDVRVSCSISGNWHVIGSMTGTLNANASGLLQMSYTQVPINCIEVAAAGEMIGDPYISMSGTFSFLNGNPSTAQSFSMNGGVRWNGGSMQVHLSVNNALSANPRMTGTITICCPTQSIPIDMTL